jgi:CheY-like chemotaxis protein
MQRPMGAEPPRPVILVVEDANFSSRAERMTLEADGYEVITTEEGSAAIPLAKRYEPELIVLDLGLPDIDGLSVAKALKADEETRDIPILICSADERQETVDACLEAGCSEYLMKPFSAEQFLEAVERVLGLAPEPDDAA